MTTAMPIQSFQVFDEEGRIWPPGFRSRLCDPDDALCILDARARAAAVAVAKSRERARDGSGWGNGSIPGLKRGAAG